MGDIKSTDPDNILSWLYELLSADPLLYIPFLWPSRVLRGWVSALTLGHAQLPDERVGSYTKILTVSLPALHRVTQ